MSNTTYCYCYDESGAYTHSEIAQPNPRAEGEFLLPARSTLDPVPPAPWADHLWPRRTGDAWQLVPDYRDLKYYKKSDGTPVSLGIGEEPDEALTGMEPQPGEVWDDTPRNQGNTAVSPVGWRMSRSKLEDRAKEVAKAHRNTLWESGTLTRNGNQFRFDANMQAVLLAIHTSGISTVPDPRPWSAVDGTEVQLTHADFIALGEAEVRRRDTIFRRYREILDLIPWSAPAPWSLEQLEKFVQNPLDLW